MIKAMQSEGNSECIYISDESPGVPHLAAISKSPFELSNVSCSIGTLVDEIEMEDVSDEVIVPVTPSPLLNNKRQQHITIGRGIKRTCLEKAFSTMSTSSTNCTNVVDMMDCDSPKQEGIIPKNNSKSVNGKDGNVIFPITGLSKNDVPSKEKEILPFPHKLTSKNAFNSSKNGILKPENSFNGIHALEKPKVLKPRSTVVINSDSDDSADNVAETSFRNFLHPFQSTYDLRSSKEYNSENNKVNQKNRTMARRFSMSNKPPSEKLFENYSLMKAKKFANKCSSTFVKTDSNSRGKACMSKECSNLHLIGQDQDDVSSVPLSSRSFKNQFRLSKHSPKSTRKDHHHHEQDGRNSTSSYNNSKSAYSVNKSKNQSDKNTESTTNQKNYNAAPSTSSKCENGRIRRKHTHRGRIARFPVDDSDTDLEFYDAKSDLSDLADSKRLTKATRRKKPQRRQRHHVMECLSSDSSSDVSIVSEMHFSQPNHRASKQHTRNTESPDPVEQVRQMEEDERLAYMLQAQFDAELEGNISNEEIGGDFNSSFLSSLSVETASSSSDSSSSSSVSATTAEAMFPFLVSNSLSPRILRDVNGRTVEPTRRSTRLEHRQQSIIGWIPENFRTMISAWMPNFTEDNTYESLLEISEQIGEESRGLKKQQINGLPTRKFSSIKTINSSASGSGSQECQDCTICLCEYQNNDILRSLPCCHEFHATCIDKWLKSHSTCPICRVEVSLRRQYGRKRKS